MDPILLTQKLIQCPSITPEDKGCLDQIESILMQKGFICHRLPAESVDNLYARYGTSAPHFCFAGHTDVVPVADESKWSHPPFAGVIDQDYLIGRGVVDMKGAIGSFLSALCSFLDTTQNFSGSISLILTSDEEGPALHGTKHVVQWLKDHPEILPNPIDFCLVGEPTNPEKVGEMVKIGRRGSLNATITATGIAGHIAYPENALNPIPILLTYLQKIQDHTFDTGMAGFDPTHLEISTIDVKNEARNVIPAQATAHINIRFNPCQTGEGLSEELKQQAALISPHLQVDCISSGDAFYGLPESKRSPLEKFIGIAIQKITNFYPVFSTTGGTSDARFLKDLCPVMEFGLVSKTAHQINERILTSEIRTLTTIYHQILQDFFS